MSMKKSINSKSDFLTYKDCTNRKLYIEKINLENNIFNNIKI